MDIYDAYKTWPADVRAKLSLHDLRRMTGWELPNKYSAERFNSLLTGTTPSGVPYGLHGSKESVEAVSDMLADAERLAEALRKIVDIDYVKRCCNNGIEVHYPDEPPEMECCGDPDVDFGPLAQIAMDALAAHEVKDFSNE